jgi:hypothetical protein
MKEQSCKEAEGMHKDHFPGSANMNQMVLATLFMFLLSTLTSADDLRLTILSTNIKDSYITNTVAKYPRILRAEVGNVRAIVADLRHSKIDSVKFLSDSTIRPKSFAIDTSGITVNGLLHSFAEIRQVDYRIPPHPISCAVVGYLLGTACCYVLEGTQFLFTKTFDAKRPLIYGIPIATVYVTSSFLGFRTHRRTIISAKTE